MAVINMNIKFDELLSEIDNVVLHKKGLKLNHLFFYVPVMFFQSQNLLNLFLSIAKIQTNTDYLPVNKIICNNVCNISKVVKNETD